MKALRGPKSHNSSRPVPYSMETIPMNLQRRSWLPALLLTLAPLTLQAQQLRIGLAEDPDILDPTLARTFVGRIVFAALCDKLFDVDEKLNIVPQLATGYEWSSDGKTLTIKLRNDVTFHDGEKMDAAAVKFNIERHKTMAGSNRSGELRPVNTVDVVDATTVRLNLSAPFAPLMAVLADRAGMMVSPKAAQAGGANFGVKPVCSGPYKFVERVAQDRMVFERYANYWNKSAIHFDKITYTPIPDATVRLANLRSGQLDFAERVASSDMEALKKDNKLKTASIVEIGYQGITINIGKSDRAQKNPLGRDAKVREAFELSLDRKGLAQVVMDNEAQVGNQWVAPNNSFYVKSLPVPKRNVERARALLKEAGVTNPSFTLMTTTTSDAQRLALVIQAMARDAGFDVKIQATEFATSLNLADKGDFDAYVLAWSGRADPDGNLYSFHGCKQPLNYAGYCSAETDALLDKSRALRDPAERKKVFEQIAANVLKERPVIYLYHRNVAHARDEHGDFALLEKRQLLVAAVGDRPNLGKVARQPAECGLEIVLATAIGLGDFDPCQRRRVGAETDPPYLAVIDRIIEQVFVGGGLRHEFGVVGKSGEFDRHVRAPLGPRRRDKLAPIFEAARIDFFDQPAFNCHHRLAWRHQDCVEGGPAALARQQFGELVLRKRRREDELAALALDQRYHDCAIGVFPRAWEDGGDERTCAALRERGTPHGGQAAAKGHCGNEFLQAFATLHRSTPG